MAIWFPSARNQAGKRSQEGERILRSERYFGKVSRSFQLGQEVDDGRAAARFNDGVLGIDAAQARPEASASGSPSSEGCGAGGKSSRAARSPRPAERRAWTAQQVYWTIFSYAGPAAAWLVGRLGARRTRTRSKSCLDKFLDRANSSSESRRPPSRRGRWRRIRVPDRHVRPGGRFDSVHGRPEGRTILVEIGDEGNGVVAGEDGRQARMTSKGRASLPVSAAKTTRRPGDRRRGPGSSRDKPPSRTWRRNCRPGGRGHPLATFFGRRPPAAFNEPLIAAPARPITWPVSAFRFRPDRWATRRRAVAQPGHPLSQSLSQPCRKPCGRWICSLSP